MRLNELLACVGLDAAQFTNYKRRDQLPFHRQSEFSVAPGGSAQKKWTNYTLSDALRLQIMVNLSEYRSPDKATEPEISKRYDGLPPMAASAIAGNGEGNAVAKYGSLSAILNQRKDIWHVTMANASLHEGELWYGMDHFAGTLVECTDMIEEKKEGQVRAILFNVSQALQKVLDAGEAHAIPEIVDFIVAENA